MTTVSCSSGITPSTVYGELTLGGVLMHRPAWDVLNVTELWAPIGARRGTDVKLPGVPGMLAMPRRLGSSRVTLQLVISAEVDRLGATTASLAEGLEANVDWLRTNLTDPYPPGSDAAGTILASLVMPSGEVRTGRATVELFLVGWDAGTRRTKPATLDLTIHAGVLS